MEDQSGVKFHEAQVAMAREWIGNPFEGVSTQQTVSIKVPEENVEGAVITKDTKTKSEDVPLPQSDEEARLVVKRFEEGANGLRGDEDVSDIVSQHMLSDKTSLLEETWLGTEDEERAAYVFCIRRWISRGF